MSAPVPQTSTNSSKRRVKPKRSAVTRRELYGHKLTPPSNPPDVIYQPWMHINVVFIGTSKTTITVDSLASRLIAQSDPQKTAFKPVVGSTKPFLLMKVDSIQAWNLSTGSRMLALSVVDFSDNRASSSGVEHLASIIDAGSSTSPPKVGYRYPASHRTTILRNDSDESSLTLAELLASPNDQIIAHFRVYYRFDGPSVLPGYTSVFQDISTACSTALTYAKDSNASLKHMKKHFPVRIPTPLGMATLTHESPLFPPQDSASQEGDLASTSQLCPSCSSLSDELQELRARIALIEVRSLSDPSSVHSD